MADQPPQEDQATRNLRVIEEFRATGGHPAGRFEGAPIVLMHTIGAKSGKEHLTPVMYLPDNGRIVVFASKGGHPSDPDWYRNIKANPRFKVEVGSETFEVQASEVTGKERDELYAKQAAAYGMFADYEAKTKGVRTIPVVALSRV